tara:strand:+ start:3097 stop:3264 length:168 start_codon:yes stop_codon:yes gene_type:complete
LRFLNSSLSKHFCCLAVLIQLEQKGVLVLGVDCLYSNDNDNDNKSSIMGIDGQAL